MNIYVRTLNTFLVCMLPWLAYAGPANNAACDELAGLTIIGQVEHVTILPYDVKLKARIDTGAEGSSLSATNIVPFERDGKKWLRFSIVHPDANEPVVIESAVVDTVKIKRHDSEGQKRPVVKLLIKIGGKTIENEFSLTDRSKFEYPVLVGRNLLSGRFLVDVNKRFADIEKKTKEE